MLYFDVTRVLEWQGRYTGMEVVAYEIASAIHQNSGRLIYFIPGSGFVDVTEKVVWSERQLTYPHVRQGSLRSLARQDPRKALKEYRRRQRLNKLEPVVFTPQDMFFTSDGLWDRQEYIDAVLTVSKNGARIIHLVHDIVPIVVPHLVHDYMTTAMNGYFNQVAPVIDKLISISKNTQKDFLANFGSRMKSGVLTAIFHHGDDVPKVTPVRPAILEQVDEFLLCVGTIEIRKNHALLYQTYKLAAERGVNLPPLVIIGREGWLADQTLKLMRDDPEISDKFIFVGPAPDSEMVWCYRHCLFTVMPSFYEGWGLPVAQSLNYGKVVASSSAGPLPEVGGDLNVYYSPYSADECLKALNNLLDESVRQTMESRINNEYKTITWHTAVGGVLKIL